MGVIGRTRNPVALVLANCYPCEAIPFSIKAISAVSRRGAEFAEKGLILGKVTYYKGDAFSPIVFVIKGIGGPGGKQLA